MLYRLGLLSSFTATQNLISRMIYLLQTHEIRNHEYLKNLPKQKKKTITIMATEMQGEARENMLWNCTFFVITLKKITEL